MFAAGSGAYVVAYVCATDGRRMRVLNGNGEGGSVLELPTMHPRDYCTNTRRFGSDSEVGLPEVAVDWATGDIFSFEKEKSCWVPNGNVGI
ncbi:unnamed protein product, partial [Choristocarpus tenellus]